MNFQEKGICPVFQANVFNGHETKSVDQKNWAKEKTRERINEQNEHVSMLFRLH